MGYFFTWTWRSALGCIPFASQENVGETCDVLHLFLKLFLVCTLCVMLVCVMLVWCVCGGDNDKQETLGENFIGGHMDIQ